MARIAGIKTEKDQSGHVTSVTIDVKKHKEIVPVLQQMGLLEKTQLEKDCEEGMSVEEFSERIKTHIDGLPWKK